MSFVPQWCGGAYKALSPVIAADTCVNLFTETREVPGSAKQVAMYGTPGQLRFLEVDTNSCRGWFSQDGRTFVVVGATLYSVDTTAGTATSVGTIVDDGFPVSFASNGSGGEQIGIVGGGQLKVYDTGTASLSAAVTLPFSNPVMIAFIDGYALINEADSPIVWFSALEDMTSWDALDFFARSNTSDNIVAIGVSRDRVWTFGTQTTTLFYDSGDADTPFIPYPGTTTQVGITGPWTLAVQDDVFYWLGQTNNGTPRAYRATDPQPQVISTPPIDLFLQRCRELETAEVLLYEQEGHLHVTWTCNSADHVVSYTYDVREQLWHARGNWDAEEGQYYRWRPRGTVTVGGTVYVGDYEDGRLYTLDLGVYMDDCEILRRERTAPYLSAENQWLFVDSIEMGIEAGGATQECEQAEDDIPAGSLVFSGFGSPEVAKFYTPDGNALTAPPWAPMFGDDNPAGCNGLRQFPSGQMFVSGTQYTAPDFLSTVVVDSDLHTDQADVIGGITQATFSVAGSYTDDECYGTFRQVANPDRIYVFNNTGTQTATISLGGPLIAFLALGMIDQITAYFAVASPLHADSPKVFKRDIGGASTSTFTTEPGMRVGTNFGQALLVLPNGDVLVGWQTDPSGDGYVKHYSSAGALLYTYTLPGTNRGPNVITPSLTPSDTFFISYYNDDAITASGITVAEIELVTGTVLHTFNPEESTYPFDGPFCVLNTGIMFDPDATQITLTNDPGYLTLEISRDGGRTWVNAGIRSMGDPGDYTARTIWRKLGRARADRLVFRASQTSANKSVWSGLWIDAQNGTGAL